MRAREFVSSVGAGGSLIVAGLVCLVFFTSLLAFRGWPDAAPASPDGSAELRTPAAKADGRLASGPVLAATLAPAPAAAGSDGAGPRPRRPVAPAPGAGAPAEPATPVAAAPARPVAPARSAQGRAPSAGAAPAPGLAQSVTQVGREVVQPVVDPLPPVVQEPASAVLDTTEVAAEVVDGTLDPLLP
jgi:hypothetical protein